MCMVILKIIFTSKNSISKPILFLRPCCLQDFWLYPLPKKEKKEWRQCFAHASPPAVITAAAQKTHKGSSRHSWASSPLSVTALMQIPSDTKQNEERSSRRFRQIIRASRLKFWYLSLSRCYLCFSTLCAYIDELTLTETIPRQSAPVVSRCSITIACDNKDSQHTVRGRRLQTHQ